MIRRSFCILFDAQFKITFFPPEHHNGDVDQNMIGHLPWEFVVNAQAVQSALINCKKTGEPQFVVVVLNDDDPTFPGQLCCSWLHRVNAPSACKKECAAVLAKCVIVPELLEELSDQQIEMLAMIAEGNGPNDVAASMGISRTSVDTQLARARKKLELNNLVQLAVWSTTYRDILDPKVILEIESSREL